MFLYEKKIVYLSCYREGIKKSSAGFIRISRERDACLLDIHIKNAEDMSDGDYALFLVLGNREMQWGTVSAKGGSATKEKRIMLRGETAYIGQESFKEEELSGVLIHLEGDCWIAGYWKRSAGLSAFEKEESKAATGEKKPDTSNVEEEKNFPVNRQEMKQIVDDDKGKLWENTEPDIAAMSVGNGVLLETASEDKWEQLQRGYKKVHPFGDERLFLSIEPKDFVILQASCQKLVNNSFLLHGFYNYRHLILGPDAEIGDGDNTCFYLGVPGTYFEREKMVAVMFGFEGFECSGAVEIGKFGYYMRRVEL